MSVGRESENGLHNGPLSRLDISRIIESIDRLYRALESPDVQWYWLPDAAAESGYILRAGRCPPEIVIALALDVIRKRIAPSESEADIEQSRLDREKKRALIDLLRAIRNGWRDQVLLGDPQEKRNCQRMLEEVRRVLRPELPESRKPAGRKGVPLAEAEIKVRDWLAKHAKDKPAGITRDAVAAGTGVSGGQISNTAAWKAFRERRDAQAKPGARNIPLTDAMLAVIPSDCAKPDELAELIEEQQLEAAEQNRHAKRRHRPS